MSQPTLNESELLLLLNDRRAAKGLPQLKHTEDPFCRYDAEADDIILEMKSRRRHYPDLIIGTDKVEALVEIGEAKNKRPILAISTPKGVWAYDVFKIRDNAKLGAIETREIAVSATTQYERKDKVKRTFFVLYADNEHKLEGEAAIKRYASPF